MELTINRFKGLRARTCGAERDWLQIFVINDDTYSGVDTELEISLFNHKERHDPVKLARLAQAINDIFPAPIGHITAQEPEPPPPIDDEIPF